MTATQTQLRRGTESQCEAMVPAEAEVVVDLTNDRLRLGDGLTFGGIPIPNAYDIQNGAFNYASASGTNTLTVGLDPVATAYGIPMTVIFKAANNNTGSVTLNVDGLGAKSVMKASGGAIVNLIAGDIVAGAFYTCRYDGTQFVMEAGGGNVNSVTGSGGVVVSPTTGAPVVSLDTNNSGGVGCIAILRNATGFNISDGATASGSSLRSFKISGSTGFPVENGTPSGTWRNISGGMLLNADWGFFIRTA